MTFARLIQTSSVDKIEAIAIDVARLGSASEAHRRISEGLTNELSDLRRTVSLHDARINEMGATVQRTHALVREIHDRRLSFAPTILSALTLVAVCLSVVLR